MNTTEQPTIEERVFDFLVQKYVQRADDRQKSIGLQYTEAETHDLAKELSRLIEHLFAEQGATAANRIANLEAALDLALAKLIHAEPGDSRAVSDDFVAMAVIACDLPDTESSMAIINTSNAATALKDSYE